MQQNNHLSIIIPTLNEGKLIGHTVQMLKELALIARLLLLMAKVRTQR
jgi:glycosyltransferase involved in cell wall biosynthesis